MKGGTTLGNSEYYDGTKLLSMKDINGNTPEVFMCTSNRNAGKTTYFYRLCVRRFLNEKGKFCLVFRFNYELDDVADKFFKDIGALFFPRYFMRSERKAKGIYHELFLCGIDEDPKTGGRSCGYAISLNSADSLKKMSHLFNDVEMMVFDEFQSETNHYCADEVSKLISVHTSFARGRGEQVRYLPIYMCANPVSLINPYYVSLGISGRLQEQTKFLRGDGFVLEQGFVESASNAQKESGFNRAFSSSTYIAYASEAIYLNDNKAFIEKPKGRSVYMCTLRFNNTDFGVRMFRDLGIIYCDARPDMTFPTRFAITTNDFNVNYVMLKSYEGFFSTLRYYFEKGCFRFQDLRSKEAILCAISY